ncbi:hypothetical protein [Uliginosibacterium gangwonense]|uniref:hypothetical protein n=1 Tax=Uliginosibacterium gangwonense TaxID=392736 RepID=UPI0003A4AD4E
MMSLNTSTKAMMLPITGKLPATICTLPIKAGFVQQPPEAVPAVTQGLAQGVMTLGNEARTGVVVAGDAPERVDVGEQPPFGVLNVALYTAVSTFNTI